MGIGCDKENFGLISSTRYKYVSTYVSTYARTMSMSMCSSMVLTVRGRVGFVEEGITLGWEHTVMMSGA